MLIKELLSIFRGDTPLKELATEFTKMFGLAQQNARQAGHVFFDDALTPESRTQICDQDIEINQGERKVRKILVAHLALKGNQIDAPYALLMMNVVKDVERLGDYAKNLLQIRDLYEGPLPDDNRVAELRDIRSQVDQIFENAFEIFNESHSKRALKRVQQCRDLCQRCDVLVTKVSQSDYDAKTTTAMILSTRYYKRFAGHLANILSSVVMPLHKVDFFDEDSVVGKPPGAGGAS